MKLQHIHHVIGSANPKLPMKPPGGDFMIERIEYDNWTIELWRQLVNVKQGALQCQVPLWYFLVENKNALNEAACVGVPQSLGLEKSFLKIIKGSRSSVIAEALKSDEVLNELALLVPAVAQRLAEVDLSLKEKAMFEGIAPHRVAGEPIKRKGL